MSKKVIDARIMAMRVTPEQPSDRKTHSNGRFLNGANLATIHQHLQGVQKIMCRVFE